MGPLGEFYYPASGGSTSLTDLVDAGSRDADEAGLYHYTTTHAFGKEEDSPVDIGFHYAAVEYYTASEPPDVLAHWKLDDGTGSTAVDSSGNGHDGTLYNGPTWNSSGQVDGALSLDGSDDYVRIPNASELEVGDDDADFTVTWWMKLKSPAAGSYRAVLHKAAAYGQRTFFVYMPKTDDRLLANISTTQSWQEGVASVSTIPVDEWAHVTYLKAGGTLRLYVNGALDAEQTLVGTSISNTGPIYLADDPWHGATHCELDDVRIYDRALSDDEITGLATLRLLDTDGDGLPDYFEDRDGDGSVDAGETDWTASNSGISGPAGLQVFTPLD